MHMICKLTSVLALIAYLSMKPFMSGGFLDLDGVPGLDGVDGVDGAIGVCLDCGG